MAKYYFTNRAVDDLSDIWNYTFDAWSEQQADKYYELLSDGCQQLANNPNLGKLYTEIGNLLLGYKLGEHVVFYTIINNEEIEIVRILHSRMDLKKKFY
ncbi:type II toxin-antitoxin system RelE/ParE family toxin [Flavobacterium zepuense]|uniref:Toxin n=1 Tax=Flavobacterium zepuense TaxID=2593302 RepID=A0A552VAG9_9FLAO|nr:type II toxin-antitoxin system RelE/ParE family toxin [Flavobacterium zepuense]TRW27350.1 type II toxin-antitoxin system RelE/ParE family toxin [Flavobacterium zepuense]